MSKLVFLLLFSIGYLSGNSQSIKRPDVFGKWILNTHTVTINNKEVKEVQSNKSVTYFFYPNREYTITVRLGKETFENKGKWKIIDSGKKLHLYNIVDLPHKTHASIGNYDLDIKYLSGEYYLIATKWDAVNSPHMDYYKKAK